MFVKHSLTTALVAPVALVGSIFFESRKPLLHVTMPDGSVNLVEWADSVVWTQATDFIDLQK